VYVLTPRKAPIPKVAPAAGAVAGEPAPLDVAKRWFKHMNRSDAQQTPSGTNPTRVLRSSQEEFAIDWTRYFVDVFFGQLEWTPSSRNTLT
jgi:hypothetical protein